MLEGVISTVIKHDPLVSVSFPDWTKEILYSEPHLSSAEFPLVQVARWLHPGQKNGGYVRGTVIFEYLKSEDMLRRCLSFADARAIQQKGLKVFRHFFQGTDVYFWRHVVGDDRDELRVPFLCERNDALLLRWDWLDSDWFGNAPALQFS